MTTLHVQLPESTLEFLREEAQARGLSSPADYLVALAAEAESNHDRLEKELIKGLESGPSRPMTQEDWDELKAKVRERSGGKSAP
jgi:hypothetical protein